MAGDHGWACSISIGATAIFEYLPREHATIPTAVERAQVRAQKKPIQVEISSGDCLFFHGGYLPHRIASCASEAPAHFAHMAVGTGLVRLNLQVRPFGADRRHRYSALAASGYHCSDESRAVELHRSL